MLSFSFSSFDLGLEAIVHTYFGVVKNGLVIRGRIMD